MVKCRSLGRLFVVLSRTTDWVGERGPRFTFPIELFVVELNGTATEPMNILSLIFTHFPIPWGLYLLRPHRHRRPPRLQLVSAQLGRFSSSNNVSLRMRNLRGSQLQPNLQYTNNETPMECLRRWGSPVQVSENGRKREWNDDYDGPFKVGKVLPMFGQ